MASKVLFKAAFSMYLLLPFFAFLAIADNFESNPIPSETICDSTPNPSYCKALLPKQNAKVHDFGRFSLQKSLFQSRKLLQLANFYLRDKSRFSQGTIRALEDCIFLSELNVEYLSNSNKFVMKTIQTVSTSEVDDAQSFLSAILTNHQTCLDGLMTTASDLSIKNGLLGALSEDTKLHTLSLALFTKGWVHEKKNKTMWDSVGWHSGFRNGRLPLKMSSRVRSIYESLRGRGRGLQSNANDSVVVSDMVVVSEDGSGNFTTINDAIAAAPNNSAPSDGYFLIYITRGVYQEYVSIPKTKNNLMLLGDGINQTIITGNHSVVDGWTTFNSPTFAVVAADFVAVNITFRNTAGAIKEQAVALRSGADMSSFYSCSFEGYQDTLYTHSMRQFYRECDIYGTVDFIFGNAAVVLQNCNIYPRLPLSGQFNTITAQGRTDINQNTGTSIQNATITAADDLAGSVSTVETYLGRPWKQYSRTVFMESFMDSLINSAGWHDWNGSFALDTLYYAEYNNRGPGSDTTNRVTWPGYHVINATDAANFTVSNFLQGDAWLPQTGVPYLSGL
ncbi:putative pectinesterase/pectinesterase inhibitor 20 [Senna tora]|uniref:Pectinesterase n=1 Tax=Senna tora TaxID=362788 RepID=A0A834TAX0_9FABA|nr:putative pectinesterase/pectinesterase inhibitor 20 [Senna tora]